MSASYSTGQLYTEQKKLEWLMDNVIDFKDSTIKHGMSQLLIATPSSEVEAKDLQRKVGKMGLEVDTKDGIVYISLRRKKEYSLLVQGLVMIALSIAMNVLLGVITYYYL